MIILIIKIQNRKMSSESYIQILQHYFSRTKDCMIVFHQERYLFRTKHNLVSSAAAAKPAQQNRTVVRRCFSDALCRINRGGCLFPGWDARECGSLVPASRQQESRPRRASGTSAAKQARSTHQPGTERSSRTFVLSHGAG